MSNKRVASSSSGDPRKRRKVDINARFDNMVDTMSALHSYPSAHTTHNRKTLQRSARANYSPPRHPARNLNSDSSSDGMRQPASVEKSPSRDSSLSKSLPSWLAKAFMSLARKHPLRLLLPPDMRSSPEKESCHASEHTKPGGLADISEEKLFAFDLPVDEQYPRHPSNKLVSSSLAATNPYLGSLLGSSVESSTVFSAYSPETCSSPTFFAGSHTDANSDLFKPHIFNNSSESDHLANVFNASESTDETDLDTLMPDLVHNPLFSDIYWTPGPGYYTSHATHFDSPTEDPLTPNRHHELYIEKDGLDFQWKTFDRKHITAPSLARGTAAFGPLQSPSVCNVHAGNFIDTTWSKTSLPSPSPFRFSPFLEKGDESKELEDFKVEEDDQIPPQVPLLPAYGISASRRDRQKDTTRSETTFDHLSGNTFQYAIYDNELDYSPVSSDSIESWGNDRNEHGSGE